MAFQTLDSHTAQHALPVTLTGVLRPALRLEGRLHDTATRGLCLQTSDDRAARAFLGELFWVRIEARHAPPECIAQLIHRQENLQAGDTTLGLAAQPGDDREIAQAGLARLVQRLAQTGRNLPHASHEYGRIADEAAGWKPAPHLTADTETNSC